MSASSRDPTGPTVVDALFFVLFKSTIVLAFVEAGGLEFTILDVEFDHGEFCGEGFRRGRQVFTLKPVRRVIHLPAFDCFVVVCTNPSTVLRLRGLYPLGFVSQEFGHSLRLRARY